MKVTKFKTPWNADEFRLTEVVRRKRIRIVTPAIGLPHEEEYEEEIQVEKRGEQNHLPSLTVPDQSMSVRELMRRSAQGLSLGGRIPMYEGTGEDDDDLSLPDWHRLDLTEKADLIRANKERIEGLKKKMAEEAQKQKEAKEAKDKADREKNERDYQFRNARLENWKSPRNYNPDPFENLPAGGQSTNHP